MKLFFTYKYIISRKSILKFFLAKSLKFDFISKILLLMNIIADKGSFGLIKRFITEVFERNNRKSFLEIFLSV